jgi:hypothetical protein
MSVLIDQPAIALESRWRARQELADSVDRLATDLAHVGRIRKRRTGTDSENFLACVNALLCNFAAIELAAPGRSLATARRKFGGGSEIHGKAFVRTLDAMEAAGLIVQARGEWSAASSRHEISRSWATPALLGYLPMDLDHDCLSILAGPPIEVRARKNSRGQSDLVAVPATDESKLLAAQVAAVNAWLTAADVRRQDGVVLSLIEPESRSPSITSTRAWSLRRVFNNGTLAHGGRLAGGWWLGMSQKERARLILIEGEPITELDFVCMVPRVCYALRGVPWPFGGDKDAPYVCGPHTTRDTWKRWVNSMLFAQRAMGSWVGKDKADRLAFADKFSGLDWKDARDLVLKRHTALAEAGGFGCELGMEGMRAEADIAVDVVLRLRDLGVTCLPIHDGYAVAGRHAEAAKVAMVQAAECRLGVPLAVATK